MSVIGPRPQLVRDMVFMTEEQRMRHTAKPGLSGLAQVNGRNAISWEDKIEWDLKYIEKVSFKEDLKIIFATVKKAFIKQEGITQDDMATAEDLGDYLLRTEKVDKSEYEEKQHIAKRILNGEDGIERVEGLVSITELVNYEGDLSFTLQNIQKLVVYSISSGRIFRGMIYIPIGMLLANKKVSSAVSSLVLIIGFVVAFFTNNNIISSYLLIVISIAFFELVKSAKLENRKIYLKLRSLSTTIYLVHMYVWTFYYKIVYGEKTYGLDSFLATLIISILVCLVINLKSKIKGTRLSQVIRL